MSYLGIRPLQEKEGEFLLSEHILIIEHAKKIWLSFPSYPIPFNKCRYHSFVYISWKSISQYVIRYCLFHVITLLKLKSVCTLILLDTWANLTACLVLNMGSMLLWQRNTTKFGQVLVVDGLVFEVVPNSRSLGTYKFNKM
jgi:hypothetical protein